MIEKYIMTFENLDPYCYEEMSLRYWRIEKEPEYWLESLVCLNMRGFRFGRLIHSDLKPTLAIL